MIAAKRAEYPGESFPPTKYPQYPTAVVAPRPRRTRIQRCPRCASPSELKSGENTREYAGVTVVVPEQWFECFQCKELYATSDQATENETRMLQRVIQHLQTV